VEAERADFLDRISVQNELLSFRKICSICAKYFQKRSTC